VNNETNVVLGECVSEGRPLRFVAALKVNGDGCDSNMCVALGGDSSAGPLKFFRGAAGEDEVGEAVVGSELLRDSEANAVGCACSAEKTGFLRGDERSEGREGGRAERKRERACDEGGLCAVGAP
jgi:hypothetical protein